ncbi:hypothetical protein [Priestia megaterium]|uniref:Uncharacterized protein n=1 Tax=Priestia megaterium TaxID=1404 RepID=A0A6M6E915_PRIMG|nr:hypothetical protein [Priestia megaterium]QJX80918.1 hypothetical protein FDZ14_33035 [Priestia megaterium]
MNKVMTSKEVIKASSYYVVNAVGGGQSLPEMGLTQELENALNWANELYNKFSNMNDYKEDGYVKITGFEDIDDSGKDVIVIDLMGHMDTGADVDVEAATAAVKRGIIEQIKNQLGIVYHWY